MNELPPALILGSDTLTGLQAARILWRKGVTVIGVASDTTRSYCRTRAVARTLPFSSLQADVGLEMEKLVAEYGQRPVVMTCTDDSVWWLSENRGTVGRYANFLLPPAQTLELLADKRRFYEYTSDKDLQLPRTQFVSTLEELRTAAAEITFPVILKPPRKSVEWMQASGDLKVVKVESPAELLALGEKLLAAVDGLILQRWIEGPDANMHSLYFYLDPDSEPLVASIVAKKLRQWPPDIGVGSLAVEVKADELARAGLDLLKHAGYVGPGSIQFKQDAVSGEFYIIEMNARIALNFPLFEACGVEAIYTGYRASADLPLPEHRGVTRPGAKWICWKRDLASAFALWRRGQLSPGNWLASLRGKKWSADIQWDDPGPLLADIAGKAVIRFGRHRKEI